MFYKISKLLLSVSCFQAEAALADERARREHSEAELDTLRRRAEDLEKRLVAAEKTVAEAGQ